jgi:hypothetical protein
MYGRDTHDPPRSWRDIEVGPRVAGGRFMRRNISSGQNTTRTASCLEKK